MTIFDTCLKITSTLEGSDFSTVTGNFDGQGMSFGILQLNLKSETFKSNVLNFINVLSYDYFPVSIEPLQKLSGIDSVLWAKDIMLNYDNSVKKEWITAWGKFLTNPSIINLQKKACDRYFHQAKCLTGKFGLSNTDKKVMAYFYDCAVQVWSMNVDLPSIKTEHVENILQLYGVENMQLWQPLELSEIEKTLVVISHLRAIQCKQEWRIDFFTRKCSIAIGVGIIHKQKYDFRKMFMEC